MLIKDFVSGAQLFSNELKTLIITVKGKKADVSSVSPSSERPNRSDEGLTLETPAFLPFTVANLRFQLSC